jgi:hypothetical protein
VKPEPARAPDIKLYPGMVPRSSTEIYDAIGRYAMWRFHEGTIFDYPLIEQRLVKV